MYDHVLKQIKQIQKIETNKVVKAERKVFLQSGWVLFHVIKLKYFLLTSQSLSN